ncbi:MAG TPA: potassium-transporting ATPase subunit KdpC, partial [bacterium]|nr:potassium-transporting ATPase subunit KdpC [bacterium]
IIFTVLVGLIYPGVMTLLGRVFFAKQAEGSFIEKNGKKVGSELIGQPFDDPKYFWSRPSATSPYAYNAANSGGSNSGPTNPDFIKTVQGRVEALRKADPTNTAPVPMDLVTASGSGLDPHISIAAAEYQIERVSRVRKLDVKIVKGLMEKYIEGNFLGFIGDPGVNVVKLNLALDELK